MDSGLIYLWIFPLNQALSGDVLGIYGSTHCCLPLFLSFGNPTYFPAKWGKWLQSLPPSTNLRSPVGNMLTASISKSTAASVVPSLSCRSKANYKHDWGKLEATEMMCTLLALMEICSCQGLENCKTYHSENPDQDIDALDTFWLKRVQGHADHYSPTAGTWGQVFLLVITLTGLPGWPHPKVKM